MAGIKDPIEMWETSRLRRKRASTTHPLISTGEREGLNPRYLSGMPVFRRFANQHTGPSRLIQFYYRLAESRARSPARHEGISTERRHLVACCARMDERGGEAKEYVDLCGGDTTISRIDGAHSREQPAVCLQEDVPVLTEIGKPIRTVKEASDQGRCLYMPPPAAARLGLALRHSVSHNPQCDHVVDVKLRNATFGGGSGGRPCKTPRCAGGF